mmetsp:Transcript_9009/g.28626  ORF Transcript_9009/g.28626 Transcript_9009/m.28626 type:complete len:226 (+) Transcript_9009:266-943(+)
MARPARRYGEPDAARKSRIWSRAELGGSARCVFFVATRAWSASPASRTRVSAGVAVPSWFIQVDSNSSLDLRAAKARLPSREAGWAILQVPRWRLRPHLRQTRLNHSGDSSSNRLLADAASFCCCVDSEEVVLGLTTPARRRDWRLFDECQGEVSQLRIFARGPSLTPMAARSASVRQRQVSTSVISSLRKRGTSESRPSSTSISRVDKKPGGCGKRVPSSSSSS